MKEVLHMKEKLFKIDNDNLTNLVEALKNWHFRHIWTTIIITRHFPSFLVKKEVSITIETKLQEAMALESFYPDTPSICLDGHGHGCCNIHQIQQCLENSTNFSFKFALRQISRIANELIENKPEHMTRIFFGRPITLEDILSNLGTGRLKVTMDNTKLCVENLDKDNTVFIIFFWELGKPLHCQSRSTWENIARIIYTNLEERD